MKRKIKKEMTEHISIADIVGPWVESSFDSDLTRRYKEAWSKPLHTLTNKEMAMFLKENIVVEHILPLAKKRVADKFNDDSEMFDGELKEAVESFKKNI